MTAELTTGLTKDEMSALKDKYPHLTEMEIELVTRYGHLFNNTGGNEPIELLHDLVDPKQRGIASTNMPRFVLAVGIQCQTFLMARLERDGLLKEATS